MQHPSRTIGMVALACLVGAGWLASELITVSFETSRGTFVSQATLPVIVAAAGLVLGALSLISEQIQQIEYRFPPPGLK
jgi:hypothetical protein